MRLTTLSVKNYRGLRDISVPLSRFGCLIGKNNAGKSTILQSLSLFFSGNKLNSRDFFDPLQPIRIEVRFEDIQNEDLGRLAPEHREKIEQLVVHGHLTLVRKYDTDGSSKLMYVALGPKDERFSADRVSALCRGKKPTELPDAALEIFPELKNRGLGKSLTQAALKEAINGLANELPDEDKILCDNALPTGIDVSVRGMLPEPIYIPAVKNLADDVKAKESTTFGKVLGILLSSIEPELGKIEETFVELSKMFNRVKQADGTTIDARLPQVKVIENTVEQYLKESFANVALEISVPPPEVKTILSSAELLIDDGVQGHIESKGDGLRRATVFAILRAFVALNQPGAMSGTAQGVAKDRHLLLFEEPELYLHPSAQKILFDALSVFSKSNHVVITTHSPAFFGPQGTATFVKLAKVSDKSISKTPFTIAHPVDLEEIGAKDQFQLICFENNNAAFFFDSVVLVEGDSDYIVLPHIASLVSSQWEAAMPLHKFVRINGKGSIRRYREFFARFRMRVAVVTDLDLLTSGFDNIQPDEDLKERRSKLLELVDREVLSSGGFKDASDRDIKDAQEKTELVGRWKSAKAIWEKVQTNAAGFEELNVAVEAFFDWEKKDRRLQILQRSTNPEVVRSKRNLLARLRERNIYVLERGALEAYYPSDVHGIDKPTKAQDFCKKVLSREAVLALCDEHHDDAGNSIGSELEIICDRLFNVDEEQLRALRSIGDDLANPRDVDMAGMDSSRTKKNDGKRSRSGKKNAADH